MIWERLPGQRAAFAATSDGRKEPLFTSHALAIRRLIPGLGRSLKKKKTEYSLTHKDSAIENSSQTKGDVYGWKKRGREGEGGRNGRQNKPTRRASGGDSFRPKAAPWLLTLVFENALGGYKVCEITHWSLKECLISSK